MVTKKKAIYSFPSLLHIDIAITHKAIELHLKNRYHLVGTETVIEQHILVKCCKCNHFGAISTEAVDCQIFFYFNNLNIPVS